MSDDDKLAMIQALVLHGANKEAVKALKSFRNEIKKRGISQKQSKGKVMDKCKEVEKCNELKKCKKLVLFWFGLFVMMTLNWGLMLYFNIDKADQINKLNEKKTELQSKLSIKEVELDIAKRDLGEAHEMMGVLFLEAMSVTDSYNKLKKQKCKGRR